MAGRRLHQRLTPYWAEALGKDRLHARQLSRRGGELTCAVVGDRIELVGEARLYLRGTIQVN